MMTRLPFTPFFVVWYCHDVVMDMLARCGLRLEGASVLEAGCGGGSLLFRLASKTGRVLGVDVSADTVALLQKHYVPVYDNVEVHAADFSAFRSEERFDLVVSNDCFEHIGDPPGFMDSAAHALGPDGTLCLQFPNDPDHGINHYATLGELRREVQPYFRQARYFVIRATRYHTLLQRLFMWLRAFASPQLARVRRDVLADPRTRGLDNFARSACYLWMRSEVKGGVKFKAARMINGTFRMLDRLGPAHHVEEISEVGNEYGILGSRLIVVARLPINDKFLQASV